MHTWDLARATGQDDRLDPRFCALLLAGMEPMEDVIRSSTRQLTAAGRGHVGAAGRSPVAPISDARGVAGLPQPG